jgi:hypothetical protein
MRKILTILLLIIVTTTSCHSYTCNKLPDIFTSYDGAIQLVKTSTFQFIDDVKISDSSSAWVPDRFSWITSANYYSCDGGKGYFIYNTNRGTTYIHQGVPIEVWNGFKDTSSKGFYFDRYIKEKYPIRMALSDSR